MKAAVAIVVLSCLSLGVQAKIDIGAKKDVSKADAAEAYVTATKFGTRPFERAELDKMVAEASTITCRDEEDMVSKLRARLIAAAGITADEAAAINDYSGGGYKRINPNLRNWLQAATPADASLDAIRKLDTERKFITDLSSAIKKAHKQTGTVRRVISFKTAAEYNKVANLLTSGAEISSPQFDSTTFKSEVSLPDNNPFELLFTIQAKGKNGGYLSGYCNIIPKSEAETLFLPGTKFNVKTGATKPNAGDKAFKGTVELVEVEEDAPALVLPTNAYMKQRIKEKLLGPSPVLRPSAFSVAKKPSGPPKLKRQTSFGFLEKRSRHIRHRRAARAQQ